MYDDTGQDSTHSAAGGDDLTVTVNGEEYEVEAEYDIDKDGDNDTAIVEGDDGRAIAFTDADGDGDADVAVEMDANGNVVGAARYDESTGEWVPVDPKTGQETGGGSGSGSGSGSGGTQQTGNDRDSDSDRGSSGGSSSGGGEEIMVDVPDEARDYSAGEATVDMNRDGTNDTAVVQSEDGTVMAFTDTDGDGDADMLTMIESDGDVTIQEHTGEDEWETVETGRIDSSGNYTPDSGSRSS